MSKVGFVTDASSAIGAAVVKAALQAARSRSSDHKSSCATSESPSPIVRVISALGVSHYAGW